MTKTIRARKPEDPFRAQIDRTIALRRSITVEREIARAHAALNQYRDRIGYRGPTSAEILKVWAGATEGLL